jgi:hypothetical protein
MMLFDPSRRISIHDKNHPSRRIIFSFLIWPLISSAGIAAQVNRTSGKVSGAGKQWGLAVCFYLFVNRPEWTWMK